MPAFTHHIFICGNQRACDHPRGSCDPEGSNKLREAFKNEIKTRKLGPLVRANGAGCLEQCELGPVIAIYPQGIFYGNVQPTDVPRILEQTVQQGVILDDLLIREDELNNPTTPRVVERRQQIQAAKQAKQQPS
ncbi:(2Fe-2S) ferredoxin domain-containing protein [Lacunimicrobium album]